MTRSAPAVTATERTIFAATEELLVATSLTDLTVAQILERAGSSRTNFYRYFSSKYAVVAAMLDQLRGELAQVMQPWFAPGDRTPEQAVREALGAAAQVWAQHRTTLRAASEHWRAVPEIGARWTAMMDRFAADVGARIDEERRRGVAPEGPPSAVVASTLVWSSERMFHLAGLGRCGPGMEADAVEGLVTIWIGAIYLHR